MIDDKLGARVAFAFNTIYLIVSVYSLVTNKFLLNNRLVNFLNI